MDERVREGEEDGLPLLDPDEVGHDKIAKAARKKLLALIDKDSLTADELVMFKALAALVTEETKLEQARVAAEDRKNSGVDPERIRRARGRIGDVRSRLTRAAAGV